MFYKFLLILPGVVFNPHCTKDILHLPPNDEEDDSCWDWDEGSRADESEGGLGVENKETSNDETNYSWKKFTLKLKLKIKKLEFLSSPLSNLENLSPHQTKNFLNISEPTLTLDPIVIMQGAI